MIEPLARAIAMLASEIAIADRAVGLLIRKRYQSPRGCSRCPVWGRSSPLPSSSRLAIRCASAAAARWARTSDSPRESGSPASARPRQALREQATPTCGACSWGAPCACSRCPRSAEARGMGADEGAPPRARPKESGRGRVGAEAGGPAARPLAQRRGLRPPPRKHVGRLRERSWTTSPLKCMQRPTPWEVGAPQQRVWSQAPRIGPWLNCPSRARRPPWCGRCSIGSRRRTTA